MNTNVANRYLQALCLVAAQCLQYCGNHCSGGELTKTISETERKIHLLLDEARGQGAFLAPEYLIGRYKLDKPEALSVRLAFALEADGKLQKSYKQMTGAACLNAGFFLDIFSAFMDENKNILAYMELFSKNGKLMNFIFAGDRIDAEAIRDREVRFRSRIRGFLFESEFFSMKLCPYAELFEPEQTKALKMTGEDQSRIAEKSAMAWEFREFMLRNPHIPVCIYGCNGTGKTSAVKRLCSELELPLIFVTNIPEKIHPGDFMADINAEAHLSGAAVCFKLQSGFQAVDTAALSHAAMIFAITEDIDDFLENADRSFVVFGEFSVPEESVRQELWREQLSMLPSADSVNVRGLAAKYILSAGQIREICRDAAMRAECGGQGGITQQMLYECCHRKLSARVRSNKIQKIVPAYQWDELILPGYSKQLLEMACRQPENYGIVYENWAFGTKLPYGRGLSMLFAGPPGTGKTMGAQVVAGRLGLELYKVNLAAIVSKYIGETEKNLEEIFKVAEENQAILFFDESDVLFSKRTEIKDSNDKYSNMEAAYMLQRVEEYNGICILATNYMQNFDEAFKRRIKFIIDFPFPDAVYREKLWRRVFPAKVPLDADIDFQFLAKNFELSGSNIKNIALNAAFEAADEGVDTGMRQILSALRIECVKNGKYISESDLGEYYVLFER